MVAPGGVGQVDFSALEELGNKIGSHTQGASARKRLDTGNAVLQAEIRTSERCLLVLNRLAEMLLSAQVKVGHLCTNQLGTHVRSK